MSKAKRSPSPSACPCGSKRSYAECCEPLHKGLPAADAEQLMRSRYSAYALQRDDYLLKSWHPSTRPDHLDHESGTRWLGLKVLHHSATDPNRAEVTFEARYRVGGGSAVRMREHSRFIKADGHWFYVDGDLPAD